MVHVVNVGEVSTLAEDSSQVIDFSYKCRTCAQCSFTEEAKRMGNFRLLII